MKYTLPKLDYSYDALEPYIDATTMEIHHTKHHQAYINKLNEVLEKHPQIANTPLKELLQNLDSLPIPDKDKTLIKNHGGGHINHTLFWQIMGPTKQIDTQLKSEIEQTFGSIEAFKEVFEATALSHFGSGWAWLARNPNGKLEVFSLPNQDSPYLKGYEPIIGLDVWEHAYYLKYQNHRAEYVKNWWQVLCLL